MKLNTIKRYTDFSGVDGYVWFFVQNQTQSLYYKETTAFKDGQTQYVRVHGVKSKGFEVEVPPDDWRMILAKLTSEKWKLNYSY